MFIYKKRWENKNTVLAVQLVQDKNVLSLYAVSGLNDYILWDFAVKSVNVDQDQAITVLEKNENFWIVMSLAEDIVYAIDRILSR